MHINILSTRWSDGCAELEAVTDGFDTAKKIGQGGFGKVYRAILRRTDVAIKVLHEVSNSAHIIYHMNCIDVLSTHTCKHAALY